MDDLHDLLARLEPLEDVLPERALPHRADELLDDLEVDVGLEEREADLARGARDGLLVEAGLAPEVAEGVLEPVCERVEHGPSAYRARLAVPFGHGLDRPRLKRCRACDACGEENADGARFCAGCGTALPAGSGEPLEVRKTVTVLFCDVVGSTTLGEATDPETTRRVMSRYAQSMTEIVTAHGGTVERFRGDEVMAVFGVPVVHEDDALRAVRAGMEMQRRLAELNAELHATWGVELACRIGINTGEVVAGDPGTGDTFVTGDAVNLGKRLEQAAQPGRS